MSTFADKKLGGSAKDLDGIVEGIDGVVNDPLFGQQPMFVKRPVAPAKSAEAQPPTLVLPASGMILGEDKPASAEPSAERAKAATAAEPVEPLNLTWSAAAGRVEASIELECLPEGLSFPEDFPEPIRYDAGRKRLMYRGFMSAMSYRFLRSLSLDLTYLAALDELNVRSSTASLAGPAMQRHPLRWAMGALVTGGVALAVWVVMHHHH